MRLAALVLALVGCGEAPPPAAPPATPTCGFCYHGLGEVEAALRALAVRVPGRVQLRQIGASVQSRPIWALRIAGTVGGGPVLVVGGQHGREWPTIEVALHLAEALAEAPADLALPEAWVVAVANPDGLVHTHEVDRFWRRNLGQPSPVDLNRNFDAQWDRGIADPLEESFRGPAPFSEPESRALRDLVLALPAVAVMDIHAYDRSVSYIADPRRDGIVAELAAALGQGEGRPWRIGAVTEPPVLGGSLTDWSHAVGADAYLLELPPDHASNTQEYPWLASRSPFEFPEEELVPLWNVSRAALLGFVAAYARP